MRTNHNYNTNQNNKTQYNQNSLIDKTFKFIDGFIKNTLNKKYCSNSLYQNHWPLISKKHDEAFNLARQIIEKFEGLSLKAYKCSAGVWTIGYGNTSYLKDFKNPSKQQITRIIADDLLDRDIMVFFRVVAERVDSICNTNQIAALTSLAFNIGVSAFCRSTLLKTVLKNPNNFEAIEEQFLRWVKIKGISSDGLTNRRKSEFALYASNL